MSLPEIQTSLVQTPDKQERKTSKAYSDLLRGKIATLVFCYPNCSDIL